MKGSIQEVRNAVVDLEIDEIRDLVRTCMEQGIQPFEIIEEGFSKGLEIVGERFENGEYFLADLIMAGEVIKEAMPLLQEKMNPADAARRGKVILATVEGDIHEIGKNIVGLILSANGYEVIDLGVDVSASRIIDTAKSTGARLVGLSALLSTMVGSIRNVVDAAADAGLKDSMQIVIGGACTSDELKREMGADAYGETAIDALKIFNALSDEMMRPS
ncbi:MAG TPA: cobalamin-dependent protein [Deltaproteobacteria bacterium]|nr:cobalamin-dependent protein [Deltaproteobacteria bacterium]HPJ93306.1 cobalamin-dependent protein [Deltaproteobacteria bacterium]HPR52060.1 cobalamin-dependent protein [Deltaproteobacteria bacterium]